MMKVAKYIGLSLVSLAGVAILVLVSVSYFSGDSGYRIPDLSEVDTSDLIARTSNGVFLDKSYEVDPDVVQPKLGRGAPDFELTTFDGDKIRLSDYKGRPVLLNFWATWCPPCRKEMPDLQEFYTAHSDKLVIIGINWNDDLEDALELLEKYDITYINAIDQGGKVFVQYLLTAVPTSFWIDEQGVIRGYWEGAMSQSTLLEGFRKTTNALDDLGGL